MRALADLLRTYCGPLNERLLTALLPDLEELWVMTANIRSLAWVPDSRGVRGQCQSVPNSMSFDQMPW